MADGGDDEYEREIVWVCTQCGRHHQKHSPPCSRCGNVDLEKDRPDYSDLEAPGGTSYLDVLEPKYAVGYLAVIGFAVLVALSLTGIVSVPWLGGPTPPGAPGDAETYDGVSLQAIEDAYVEQLNDRRRAQDVGPLSVDGSLDDVATAFNRHLVREGGDVNMSVIPRLDQRYEPRCGPEIFLTNDTTQASSVFAGTPDGDDVASRLPTVPNGTDALPLSSRYSTIGVDVHVAPDETVYATVFVC